MGEVFEGHVVYEFADMGSARRKEQMLFAIKEIYEQILKKDMASNKPNSTELIGNVHEHFEQLKEYNFDWKSFYNGWIEGRTQMVFGALAQTK